MPRPIPVVLLVLALLTAAPAAAAPAGGGSDRGAPAEEPSAQPVPVRAHADRDRDGLSDDLEHEIAAAAPGDRVAVVVTFTAPGRAADMQRAVGPFRVRREFDLINGFSATMTVAQVRALARRAEIFRVEPDFRVAAHNDASNADFGTTAARDRFGVDGSGTSVCVLDTGVDPRHEQFTPKGVVGFFDAIQGGSEPYDDHGHGTHVAATAVGDGTGSDPAERYGGVAPGASLYAAKVLDASGSGSDSQVVAGIEWCAGTGADVLSMSLGSGTSSDGKDAISQAVDAAAAAGAVVVVAAGNSGDAPETVGSPGAAAGAITVGAVAEWSSGGDGSANTSRGVHLAPWSSRGPTADGRTKPDIVAPGVTVTSAQSGTTSGYATFSGTSMATPFAAGTVALLLQAGAAPAAMRTLLAGTAQDRGPEGQDDDWGHGLLDGYAAVAAAEGQQGRTTFPAHTAGDASVGNSQTWSTSFAVTDTTVPIAATVIIDGSATCLLPVGGSCWWYEWSGPDLDVRLTDPGGTVLQESTCPLGCHTGSVGRQETIEVMPTTAGTYVLEVFPFDGSPNNGAGGAFRLDLSHGPIGTGGANTAPTASSITATAVEDNPVTVTLSGSDAQSCDLGFAISTEPAHGTLGAVSAAACSTGTPGGDTARVTYTPGANWFGRDAFSYTVTDAAGASATGTVTIDVVSVGDGAPAAAFTASCDGLACAFADASSDPADAPSGSVASWAWMFGDGAASTARNPGHTYAAAGDYVVRLTVTDNDGSTDTHVSTVTVMEAAAPAIALDARGLTRRGEHFVDLRWSGATTRVDILRDGTRIVTRTRNDGKHRDALGGATGSFTYTVCETGTQVCSNPATVRF